MTRREKASWFVATVAQYPGVIIQVRSLRWPRYRERLFAKAIRFGVGSWGQHTATGGEFRKHLVVGDADSPKCHWTKIQDYAKRIMSGACEVRLYIPAAYTRELGQGALQVWGRDVEGRPYDWKGIREIALAGIKSLLFRLRLDALPAIRDWEWAWWCCEGVGHAWTSVLGYSVFGKPDNRATPRTVENRGEDGTLIELSQSGGYLMGRG